MRKMDAKCFQGYRPVKKEDKVFGMNKFVDIFPTNALSRKQ